MERYEEGAEDAPLDHRVGGSAGKNETGRELRSTFIEDQVGKGEVRGII